MITTVIFDMDGVIINSQSVLDILEMALFKKCTKNRWTQNDQLSIHGKSIEEVYALLKSVYKVNLAKETFLGWYDKILTTTYKERCRMNPGVSEFLEDLQSRNYTIALGSSTSHKFIAMVLERFGIYKYFQEIVSAEDVNGISKPEPDIFLLVAKKLGVQPNECLVIEDSDNGIRSAKRAGMFCIQYVGSRSYEKEETFADLYINTFRNISIDNLCAKLQNAQTSIETVLMNGKRCYFLLSEKVNASDYYSDFLLDQLTKIVSQLRKRNVQLLEIGTGRGYIPIILATRFPQIKHVIGIDIDFNTANLARKNVWLNELDQKIEIRTGNLYSSVKKSEKFDVILSAPPQIPITKKEILFILARHKNIPTYHLTTSVGGANGQKIIRQLIKKGKTHLLNNGLLVEVQADFSFSNSLRNFIEKEKFSLDAIRKKRKLLNETSLTKILKTHLNKQGYIFKKNRKGQEYFNLLCMTIRFL